MKYTFIRGHIKYDRHLHSTPAIFEKYERTGTDESNGSIETEIKQK